MYYIDPIYFLFIAPGLILALFSSLYLRYANSKYSKEINHASKNGLDATTEIAQAKNLDVGVDIIPGQLTDHFNPNTKTVSLSKDVAEKSTIASVAIAAHEMGHVEQHKSNFIFIVLRSTIVPMVNIGSTLGYFLVFIGLVLKFFNLSIIGLILFASTSIFSLITLPVEFDASRRAMKYIEELNLIPDYQRGGARAVLTAAALTYVASTLQSLGQLLYLVMRVNSSRD